MGHFTIGNGQPINTSKTNEFRSLVDKVQEKVRLLDNHKNNLESLYDYYGFERSSSLSRKNIEDHILFLFSKLFIPSSINLFYELGILERQLVGEEIMLGKPSKPYLSTIYILKDQIRQGSEDKKVTFSDWEEAIRLALEYIDVSTSYSAQKEFSTEDVNDISHLREKNVFNAAKRIKAKFDDIKIEVENGRPLISDEDIRKIASIIETNIMKIGGLNIITRIFYKLYENGLYHPSSESFLLSRNLSALGNSKIQLPIGYLFNISIKHVNSSGGIKRNNDLFAETINLATDLAALLNVQAYSIWEYFNIPLPKFREMIVEIALYDSNFLLVQHRTKDIHYLLRGMFDWIDVKIFENETGTTLEALIVIHEQLCDFIKEQAYRQERPIIPVQFP